METWTLLGSVAGLVSLLGTVYVVFRVGFRVDMLWLHDQDNTRQFAEIARAYAERGERIAVLEAQVTNLQTFIWHRAETAARLKHAVHDLSTPPA